MLASNASGRQLFSLLSGCLLCSCFTVGCATIKGEKYTYDKLPKHFVASVRENPQTIDLTRLASESAKSDVLDRGDVIEITIAAGLNEKDTVKMPVRIMENGEGLIPEIGPVKLVGLDMESAEAVIYSKCVEQGMYRSPNITVLMKKQRTNRVMVAGAVKKPSVYELPRGQSNLLAALNRAEGLDPSAGTQVVIRNPGARSGTRPDSVAGSTSAGVDPVGHSVELVSAVNDTIKVDLISATKSGTGGYQLEDGAVVYVERRDPEPLHVIGLVTRPGRFEFPIAEEIRVTNAIALAGGVSSLAADKIFIIRRKPGTTDQPIDPNDPDKVKTFVIEISLANAKQSAAADIRLSPGDVVSVEQTALTFLLDSFRRLGFNVGGTVPLLGLF